MPQPFPTRRSSDLTAVGEAQGAQLNATASNAKLPGEADVVIGRALITANMVLAEQPQISADVQMANAAYGDYVVRKARGRIDYRGEIGTASCRERVCQYV